MIRPVKGLAGFAQLPPDVEHVLSQHAVEIGSIHVAVAALGAALGVAYIGAKASEAVGRHPECSREVMVQSFLSIAFAEAIVFYAVFLAQ